LGNDLTMTAIRAWMGNNDVRDGFIKYSGAMLEIVISRVFCVVS